MRAHMVRPRFERLLPHALPRAGAGLRYPLWWGINLVDHTQGYINDTSKGPLTSWPDDRQVTYLARKGVKLFRFNTCWEYLQPWLLDPVNPRADLDTRETDKIDHLASIIAACGGRMILSVMNQQYYWYGTIYADASGAYTPGAIQHIVGGVSTTLGPQGTIRGYTIYDGGAGLPAHPTVSCVSDNGAGSGFSCTPIVTNGVLTALSGIQGGTGYHNPFITVTGGTRDALVRPTVDDGVVTPDMLGNLWKLLGAHYMNMPGIGYYDIMNEPSQSSWDVVAPTVISELRTVDTKTAIIAQMTAIPKVYADPANNIIFSVHRYFDGVPWGPGYYHDTYEHFGSYLAMGIDIALPFCQWCRDNHVRGHIGEFGIAKGIYNNAPTSNPAAYNPMCYDPRYRLILDGFYKTLEKYAPWIMGGTYFSAGGYYNVAAYYTMSWDQSAIGTYAQPMGLPDKPHLAVIQKYPSSAEGYR